VLGLCGRQPAERNFADNESVTALVLAAELLAALSLAQQNSIDRREIAEYRLTASVFEQFLHASRRIATIRSRDASFQDSPLFSQEIAQGGDIAVVAPALEARLLGHAGLSGALRASAISAREYTKFALSLVAARLALGFVEAGLLKTVPPGVATENVAFVRTHRAVIDEVLTELGVEIK
jgi:hypothetical protein